MRVLTMNVFAHHRDWPRRREVLRTGLADLQPDVALFQETVRTDTYDQVTEMLGSGYRVYHQHGRSEDGTGASFASRWPFEIVREADLHTSDAGDPTGWIGSMAAFEVAVPAPIGPVIVAHHKPTWQSGAEAERERQALAMARLVAELVAGSDRHVVLAGDLDATPDAASIRFLTGRQSLDGMSVCYVDGWEAVHAEEPGHTHTPVNELRTARWRPRPGRRIDYVMVRCGEHGGTLDVTACELAFDRPVDGIWASDHFGVWADFAPIPPTDDPP